MSPLASSIAPLGAATSAAGGADNQLLPSSASPPPVTMQWTCGCKCRSRAQVRSTVVAPSCAGRPNHLGSRPSSSNDAAALFISNSNTRALREEAFDLDVERIYLEERRLGAALLSTCPIAS